MNDSVEIIKSRQGNILLKINDLIFFKENQNENKYYWKCKIKGCKGRAHTVLSESKHVIIKFTDHTCEKNSSNRLTLNVGRNSLVKNNQTDPQRKIFELSKESIPKAIEPHRQTGSGVRSIPVDKRHMQFKHPFTCMAAGPTSSGKTVLVRRIIKDYDQTIHFKNGMPSPLKVLWAYGQWQDMYNENLDKCEIQYIDGLPTNFEIEHFKPNLIIIDDLMTELANNKNLTNLFTKGSHHLNISIIFISQNFYHQGPQMTTIKRNCHYLILMKSPNDKSQIRTLASKMYPSNTSFLISAFEDASEDRYGYIRVDCNPETPEEYRVQTLITPDERPPHCKYTLFPTVYPP